MTKIKVLQMIDKPFLGGGQINLLSLAESLDPQRFDTSVCTGGQGPLVDALREKNIPHFCLSFSKRFRRKSLIDIAALLRTQRFDILHTHGGIAGFYGRLASRKSSSPPIVVHTLHGIHYLHYRNILLKRLYIYQEKYLSRSTDAVIFVSEADQRKGTELRLVPSDKQVLIKNGIDYAAYELQSRKHPEDMEGEQPDNHPLVGCVARLHRQKGIPYLLEAVDSIRRSFPEIKVWIVGGGPQREKLDHLKDRLGISSYVSLLGEREDVPQLVSRFDVFVLPSLWEGLPYSLLEAAALGKPVVASDIDGVRELIKHEQTGLLVPPRQPLLLADAVVRLLRDRDYALRLGQNLKTAVQNTYTLDRMVSQVQTLYLKLLS
ncbi:glycosyltransferase family 4 protein [Acidobacteriota bacterium]